MPDTTYAESAARFARDTFDRWVEALQITSGDDDNPTAEQRAELAATRRKFLDAYAVQVRAEGLTGPERAMLTFALDLADDAIASRGDEFTDDDRTALASLRRMADAAEAGDR
jgi:hypothetical protein